MDPPLPRGKFFSKIVVPPPPPPNRIQCPLPTDTQPILCPPHQRALPPTDAVSPSPPPVTAATDAVSPSPPAVKTKQDAVSPSKLASLSPALHGSRNTGFVTCSFSGLELSTPRGFCWMRRYPGSHSGNLAARTFQPEHCFPGTPRFALQLCRFAAQSHFSAAVRLVLDCAACQQPLQQRIGQQ